MRMAYTTEFTCAMFWHASSLLTKSYLSMHGLDDCGMMRHGYGYGVLSHVVSGCVGCALGL